MRSCSHPSPQARKRDLCFKFENQHSRVEKRRREVGSPRGRGRSRYVARLPSLFAD